MSTKVSKPAQDDEVDLKNISSKITQFLGSLLSVFFSLPGLIKRKLIWVVPIIAVGFTLGFYLDSFKPYQHQLIVRPNFGSIDYLNSKIALLESKIKTKDTSFFLKLGIKNPKYLTDIKIKPIVDVYTFVRRNEYNFKTLELLAEDGDLNTIVQDETTSKNYNYHMIELTTVGQIDHQNIIEPILKFLNESDYFKKLQIETVKNMQSKMLTNEKLIAQIDAILESIPKGMPANPGGTVVSGESQLNDVIRTKDLLIEEQGHFRLELISLDKIIKLGNSTLNIEQTEGLSGKKKFLMPLLLLLFFGAGYALKTYNKKNTSNLS
jgi:hypothetical protein